MYTTFLGERFQYRSNYRALLLCSEYLRSYLKGLNISSLSEASSNPCTHLIKLLVGELISKRASGGIQVRSTWPVPHHAIDRAGATPSHCLITGPTAEAYYRIRKSFPVHSTSTAWTVNTGDMECWNSALRGLIILPSVKEVNSRVEIVRYGGCGTIGTKVLCSKMLGFTECYDKAAVILSALRPHDVSKSLF
jgi:hypothetical protein